MFRGPTTRSAGAQYKYWNMLPKANCLAACVDCSDRESHDIMPSTLAQCCSLVKKLMKRGHDFDNPPYQHCLTTTGIANHLTGPRSEIPSVRCLNDAVRLRSVRTMFLEFNYCIGPVHPRLL